MCYSVYISTNCPDDLAVVSTDALRFERPDEEKQTPCPTLFDSRNTWFVGSSSGCSCTFRHLCKESIDLGFDVPQDWCPEAQEEIQATRALYDVLQDIVNRGFHLSLLDCWNGQENEVVSESEVSFSKVSADQFRLFEGCHFIFKP